MSITLSYPVTSHPIPSPYPQVHSLVGLTRSSNRQLLFDKLEMEMNSLALKSPSPTWTWVAQAPLSQEGVNFTNSFDLSLHLQILTGLKTKRLNLKYLHSRKSQLDTAEFFQHSAVFSLPTVRQTLLQSWGHSGDMPIGYPKPTEKQNLKPAKTKRRQKVYNLFLWKGQHLIYAKETRSGTSINTCWKHI